MANAKASRRKLSMYDLVGIDFKIDQRSVAVTAFSPAVTGYGKTAGGVRIDDHRGRLIRPNVDLQVIAMKVQLYRFIARPAQLDHVAFGNPDRLIGMVSLSDIWMLAVLSQDSVLNLVFRNGVYFESQTSCHGCRLNHTY